MKIYIVLYLATTILSTESPVLVPSSKCLVRFPNKNNTCEICPAGYYKNISTEAGTLDLDVCFEKKKSDIKIRRIAYIAPRPLPIDSFSNEQRSSLNIYNSVLESLYNEDALLMQYEGYQTIYIKLLKGDHYAIDKDLSKHKTAFERNEVELEISPLYCNEAPLDLKSWCFENETLARIYFKFFTFSLFVANELVIKNIIFDGSDLPLFEEDTDCKNRFEVCCPEEDVLCYGRNYSKSSDKYNNFQGFIIAEPVFDSILKILPNITLINVKFQNIMINVPNLIGATLPTLVVIEDFEANIFFLNCSFARIFLPGGILIKYKSRFILNELISTDDFKFNILKESKVLMLNNNITEYNYFGKNIQTSSLTLYSVFFLDDFKGEFIFCGNIVEYGKLDGNFINLRKSNTFSKGSLILNANVLIGNDFRTFFNLEGINNNSNLICFFSNGHMIDNKSWSLFLILNACLLEISGEFIGKLTLPIGNFILSKFSFISLNNCRFHDLVTPSEYFILINIQSIYSVNYMAVFNETKYQYYSRDSVLIYNCTFSNIQFSLFSNLQLNKDFIAENSMFDNLELSFNQIFPFIELVSEGLFSLKNVTFSNINAKSFLISFPYFVEAMFEDVHMNRIFLYDTNAFSFYSMTKATLNYHHLNINFFFSNDIHFLVDDLLIGKINSCLFYTDAGNDQGPWVVVNNSKFENIIYNRLNYRHDVLSLSNSLLILENVNAFNISNCKFLLFEAKILSSNLTLINVVINIPYNTTIFSMLDGGIGNYGKAEIINSRFYAANIWSSRAVALNLAKKLYLFNLTIDVFQNYGTLVSAQVYQLSCILVKNIKIRSQKNSGATLFTLTTENNEGAFVLLINNEYTSESLEENFPFGFKDSIFESAYSTAFLLLIRTQIFFSRCTFQNLNSDEGGLLNSKESQALFYDCFLYNSFARNMGGSFYLESSKLYLLMMRIENSSSLLRGGIIYCINSEIYIKNSSFRQSNSTKGGAFYCDNSTVYIIGSYFIDSYSKEYGGFIVLTICNFSFYFSMFDSGFSREFGGVLFIEGGFFKIINSTIKKSRTQKGIFYAFNCLDEEKNIFENTLFIDNVARYDGATFLIKDASLLVKSLQLVNNTAETGYVCFWIGTQFRFFAGVYFTIIEGNKALKGLFYLNNVELELNKLIVDSNDVKSNNFWYIKEAILSIKEAYLYLNGVQKTLSSLIKGKYSKILISLCSVNLNFFANFLYCTECEQINIFMVHISNGNYSSGGIIQTLKSRLFGEIIVFRNSRAFDGGALYTFNSKIELLNSFFNGNAAEGQASDIFFISSEFRSIFPSLSLESCIFLNVIKTSIKVVSGYFSIKSSVFFGSRYMKCQAMSFLQSTNITIISTVFDSFLNMTSLTIEAQNYYAPSNALFLIKNCTFLNSESLDSNGTFIKLSGIYHVEVSNTFFVNGSGLRGGAIYFACLDFFSCVISIKNSKFINNRACLIGGAILSDSENLTHLNTNFTNNKAPVGEQMNFFPSKLLIIGLKNQSERFDRMGLINYFINPAGESNFINMNINNFSLKPGYTFSLGVLVLDQNNNIQYQENRKYISINVISENEKEEIIYSLQYNVAKVNDGVAIFENIALKGKTNVTIIFQFNYKGDKVEIKEKSAVTVLKCSRGDAFENGKCRKCPENTFSIDENPETSGQSCLTCPDNAKCLGGDVIIPNKTFWRKDANSSFVIKCKFLFACPEQLPQDIYDGRAFVYHCSPGYKGNGCEECEDGYGKMNNMCGNCEEGKKSSLILLILGYVFYYLYINFKEREASKKVQGSDIPCLKILINYFSIFTFLSSLNKGWDNITMYLFSFSTQYMNTSPKVIFSFDCLLPLNEDEKLIFSLVIAGMTPFILSIYIFIIDRCIDLARVVFSKKSFSQKINFFKKNNFNLNLIVSELFKHLVVIYFNINTMIILMFFNFFECNAQFDDTENRYLDKSPWVLCGSYFQILLAKISIGFVFLWIVIMPVLLVVFIKLNSKKPLVVKINFPREIRNVVDENSGLCKKEKIKKNKYIIFNLITSGYKKKYVWWEGLTFIRKIFFILLSSQSQKFDIISIGALALVILSFSFLLSIIFNPYQLDLINFIDSFSIFISILIIGMAVISSLMYEQNPLQANIATFVLFIAHILFLLVWIMVYFNTFSGDFKRIISAFRQKIKKK